MGSSSLNLESLLASSLKELTQLAHRISHLQPLRLDWAPVLPSPASLHSIFALGIAGMVPGWTAGSWFPRPPSPPPVLVTALKRLHWI